MATCRECKLWDIEAFMMENGKLRVYKNKAVRCLWVSKEQYPVSVYPLCKRPEAKFTCAEDGHKCQCFQKRG